MKKAYVARSSATAACQMLGETLVMSVTDSTLFRLNEAASAIWNGADGRTRLEDLVARDVCGLYEVSLEEALEDAERFVQDLSQHGVLLISDAPIHHGPEA